MQSDVPRELPKDIESEMAVLGAAMSNNDAAALALELLKPEDFSYSRHIVIFDIMRGMNLKQAPIDFGLLRAELNSKGKLDDAGGIEYLLELSAHASDAPNAEAYVRIVREKSVLRKLISAGNEIVAGAYSKANDPQDVLEDAEKKLYKLSLGSQRVEPEQISDIIQRVFDQQLSGKHDSEAAARVCFTGYHELDNMTKGFHPGELIIIAGRPSMGKSSLLLSIAANMATSRSAKRNVAVFTLEMSREQCASNMLCGLAKVPVSELRAQGVPKRYFDTLAEYSDVLSASTILIDDSTALSPSQLRSRARRLKMAFDINVIIIDYLQLMRGDGRNDRDGRQQEVAEISRGLKLLAKELGVPIIAGSQISREAEAGKDNRPKLSHLRESGAIEQDADAVMLLYRDDYYNQNSKEKGVAEVIVAKQRHGPTGSLKLSFLSEYTRFENRAVSN